MFLYYFAHPKSTLFTIQFLILKNNRNFEFTTIVISVFTIDKMVYSYEKKKVLKFRENCVKKTGIVHRLFI